MPTPTKGPRLGGGPAHERLILANLATSLFEHKRITTTEAKAKRLRPLAELSLSLKDSPLDFDPTKAAGYYDAEEGELTEEEQY